MTRLRLTRDRARVHASRGRPIQACLCYTLYQRNRNDYHHHQSQSNRAYRSAPQLGQNRPVAAPFLSCHWYHAPFGSSTRLGNSLVPPYVEEARQMDT